MKLSEEVKRVIATKLIDYLESGAITQKEMREISESALSCFDGSLSNDQIIKNMEWFVNEYDVLAVDLCSIDISDLMK